MNNLWLVIAAGLSALAILASLVGLLSLFRRRRKLSQPPAEEGTADEPLPYRQVEAFLTPNERALYTALRPAAVAHGADVFAKVHLEDLVQVRKGAPDYDSHNERIRTCRIDLLLCERERLVPLLALQIDGHSRAHAGHHEHDKFLARVLADVGLPLAHVAAEEEYDPYEVAALVSEHIGRPEAVERHAEPTPTATQIPADLVAEVWPEPAPESPWPDLPIAPGASAGPADADEAPTEETTPAQLDDSLAGLSDTSDSPEPDEDITPDDYHQALPEQDYQPAQDETPLAEIAPEDYHQAPPPQADDDTPGEELDEMPAEATAAEDEELAAGSTPWEDSEGEPKCPSCGQPLVPMQDLETGVIVLACAGYPDCPHVQAR